MGRGVLFDLEKTVAGAGSEAESYKAVAGRRDVVHRAKEQFCTDLI